MRSGDTQSVPSATPSIYLEIQTTVPEDVSSRITKFRFDEEIYGGVWEIWLDNSDSALASKDYVGYDVDLEIGFSGGTRSQYPKLWIDTQEFESYGGKLLLKLTIIDAWGLLARCNSTVGAEYWNYKEQAPGEPDANATQYAKTILQIITSVVQSALDNTFAIDHDHNDGYFNTIIPPIRIKNAKTGIFQLLEMTDSYLRYQNDNDFHVRQAAQEVSVHTFALGSNQFWADTEGSATSLPNRVVFHGTDGAGNWIDSGDNGLDATSYSRVEIYIDRHYYATKDEIGLIASQSVLNSMAASALAKVQGQRAQGSLIAPMHCSLELLDKITITDTRYSGTKTITGYVHQIIREYEANAGVYRTIIRLGGVASGYTPKGSEPPISKADDPEPSPMGLPFTPAPAFLPVVIDIPFVSVDQDDISWTAGGTIKAASGKTFTITAGAGNTLNLANSNVYYLYYNTTLDDGTIDNTQTFVDTVSHERILVGFAKKGATSSDPALLVIGSQGEDLFIDKLSAITADMGLLTAGEIRVGLGTLNVDFTGWRFWVESSKGRMAGYDDDVMQFYSDTNGRLYCAGGYARFDATAVKLDIDNAPLRLYDSSFADAAYCAILDVFGADVVRLMAKDTWELRIGSYEEDVEIQVGNTTLDDLILDVAGDIETQLGGYDIYPSVAGDLDIGTDAYYCGTVECVTLDDSHSPAPNIKKPLTAIRAMKETIRELSLEDIDKEHLGRRIRKVVEKAGGRATIPWKDKGSFPEEILHRPDEESYAKRDKIYNNQIERRLKMESLLGLTFEKLKDKKLKPDERLRFEQDVKMLERKLSRPFPEKLEPVVSTDVFAEIWMMIKAIQELADKVDSLEAKVNGK